MSPKPQLSPRAAAVPQRLSPRPVPVAPVPVSAEESQRAASRAGQGQVFHAQYNDPIGLYSAKSAADTYLLQTGGLFGTDPAVMKHKEPPANIANSATLKLIQGSSLLPEGEIL